MKVDEEKQLNSSFPSSQKRCFKLLFHPCGAEVRWWWRYRDLVLIPTPNEKVSWWGWVLTVEEQEGEKVKQSLCPLFYPGLLWVYFKKKKKERITEFHWKCSSDSYTEECIWSSGYINKEMGRLQETGLCSVSVFIQQLCQYKWSFVWSGPHDG